EKSCTGRSVVGAPNACNAANKRRAFSGSGRTPHVEILRCTYVTVNGQRVSSNHDEFNAVVVEFGKQISEVSVHHRRSTRGRRELNPTPPRDVDREWKRGCRMRSERWSGRESL